MPAGLNSNPRNTSYLVPCVFKAIQLVELLRTARAGLRVEDLLKTTGYSRSTTYRILRTLTTCDYTFRDAGGIYRLNHDVVSPLAAPVSSNEAMEPSEPEQQQADAPLEFERWGVRFDKDGKRLSTTPSDSRPPHH